MHKLALGLFVISKLLMCVRSVNVIIQCTVNSLTTSRTFLTMVSMYTVHRRRGKGGKCPTFWSGGTPCKMSPLSVLVYCARMVLGTEL